MEARTVRQLHRSSGAVHRLAYEVESDRIKSVARPSPRVWMHHIELHDVNEINEEVRDWLTEALRHAS